MARFSNAVHAMMSGKSWGPKARHPRYSRKVAGVTHCIDAVLYEAAKLVPLPQSMIAVIFGQRLLLEMKDFFASAVVNAFRMTYIVHDHSERI